jgi:hypothetical protein
MTERILLEYFQNLTSVEKLADDLKDSQKRTSFNTTSVYVIQIDNGQEFNVTKDHLIRLCNDTLNGKLTTTDINTIAFAIITSDFFTWEEESSDSALIETVIYDWDNPEIGFDLTLKNIQLWKEYLLTGNYNLDKEELRLKFRNDGKRRNNNKV